jgi:hypothetical protein
LGGSLRGKEEIMFLEPSIIARSTSKKRKGQKNPKK